MSTAATPGLPPPVLAARFRARIAAAGAPVDGQALVHLLFLAEIRGIAVRGPVVGGEHAHVLVRDRLGPAPPPPDREAALTRLAERHLTGHGPATDSDLATWAGLPLGEVRRGFAGSAAGSRGSAHGSSTPVTYS